MQSRENNPSNNPINSINNNQTSINTVEQQFELSDESKRDHSKNIEQQNELIKNSKSNLVTRVLNKESVEDEQINFQHASDLRNWISTIEAEDLQKIDQSKTKKIVDVNDRFKQQFSDDKTFFKWFYPNQQEFVKSTFIKQKLDLASKIQSLKPNNKVVIKTEIFEKKMGDQLESPINKAQIELKESDKSKDKFYAKNRVQKSNQMYNINNKIVGKFILNEKVRQEILELQREGTDLINISKKLEIKQQTVYSFLRRFFSGTSNRYFTRNEILRSKLTQRQQNEIEKYIDEEFGPGDGAKTLIKWVLDTQNIVITTSYAQSLLRQFGHRRILVKSVQFDSATKPITLARHLFNLQVIATFIANNVEIFSTDEFGLYIYRKGAQIYKKPKVNKYFKVSSRYDKKYNIAIGCNRKNGAFCIQISEKPQNSLIFHEFLVKMRDYIVDKDQYPDTSKIILCDDASFHSWPPTMANIELSEDNINLMKLGGGISMIDPAEQFINTIKSRQKEYSNDTDEIALKNLQKVINSIDEQTALKCQRMTVDAWLKVLELVTNLVKPENNF